MIKAVKEGNVATVKKLLNAGFALEKSIHSHGNMTLLMYAASSGSHDVISFLLSQGADLSARDSVGQTALHHCCRSNSVKSLCLLISNIRESEKKDLFEARSNGGVTPLIAAIQSSNLGIVAQCLKA